MTLLQIMSLLSFLLLTPRHDMTLVLCLFPMPLQSNLKGGARLDGEELNRATLIFGVLFVMYILLKVCFLCCARGFWPCIYLSICSYFKIGLTRTTDSPPLPVICSHWHSHIHIFMFEAAVLLTLKCMARKCIFSSVGSWLTDTVKVFFSFTAVWKQKSNVGETGKLEGGGARTYS